MYTIIILYNNINIINNNFKFNVFHNFLPQYNTKIENSIFNPSRLTTNSISISINYYIITVQHIMHISTLIIFYFQYIA